MTSLLGMLVAVAGAALPDGVELFSSPEALAAKVGGAQVVALGEGAHGTRGYAEAQRQLVEVLVSQHGFRLLAMELVTNDRSITLAMAQCDEAALRAALFHNPWNDAHLSRVALYRWLCDFNRRHPSDPVRVVSIDSQKPWHSGRTLREWAASQPDGGIQRSVDDMTAHCFGAATSDQIDWARSPECAAFLKTKQLDPSSDAACRRGVAAFRRAAGPVLKTPEGRRAALALDDLETWQTYTRLQFTQPAKALALREAQMSANVLAALEQQPHGKAILIAHTMHVAKTPVPTAVDDPEGWNGLTSVGTRLKRALGDRYAAVAFTGTEVAPMFGPPFPQPRGPAFLEAALAAASDGGVALVVDPRAPWVRQRPRWALQNETEPAGRAYDVAAAFDVVVYLPRVEAAQRLPAPDAGVSAAPGGT